MEPVLYAKSGDCHIAYQVLGDGPIDIVMIPSYPDHPTLDTWQDHPLMKSGIERLTSFSRLILFDVRGFGLSDRNALPTLEGSGDDVLAVLDAVGSERPNVFATSAGGLAAMMFAATYPERVSGLVLFGTFPATYWSPDYPWGTKPEVREVETQTILAAWGTGIDVDLLAPSAAADPQFRDWWTRRQRALASPGTLPEFFKLTENTDVRHVLPTIRVPTLVLHRTDDSVVPIENARYLAERIPGARYVEVRGGDHFVWAGNWDAVADEIEEFLTGSRRPAKTDRVLATVLFTDIVGSTQRASELGDHRWSELLDRHDAMVERILKNFGGKMIKTIGDGLLATFDGPARAIRCAVAIRDAAEQLGVPVRAGLHAGEVELRGDDVGGIAVHIGARIAAVAGAKEVLVSSTVKDLVAGSGLRFEDRGLHELKGVPDEWRLLAVTGEAA